MKKDQSGSVRIAASLRALTDQKQFDTKNCKHLSQVRDVIPSADGCEDCLKIGDTWVHLRLCLTCGHVGCCDNSKNKHATYHFHETKHPVIISYEPGESWLYCFADEQLLKPRL